MEVARAYDGRRIIYETAALVPILGSPIQHLRHTVFQSPARGSLIVLALRTYTDERTSDDRAEALKSPPFRDGIYTNGKRRLFISG
jgi:hypothetical protein